MSKYPKAIEPNLVGQYPALVKSGAGYFFDEVLEYRVWCHPERGAVNKIDEDYYHSFVTFEEALKFSQEYPGTEYPLALVRQIEWIDELGAGQFIHMLEERIAEWRVEWLDEGPRKPGDIESFMVQKTKNDDKQNVIAVKSQIDEADLIRSEQLSENALKRGRKISVQLLSDDQLLDEENAIKNEMNELADERTHLTASAYKARLDQLNSKLEQVISESNRRVK